MKTATTPNPHAQQTPYGGFVDGVQVEKAPHLLAIDLTCAEGPSSAFGPGVELRRPRVRVSSEADLLELIAAAGGDNLCLMDMSRESVELDPLMVPAREAATGEGGA